ncbi:MAG: hypothetical protein KIS92_04065 [Planctomycetota bacterium]|nr:hypothetical protein [Planctomycetota bacterium]
MRNACLISFLTTVFAAAVLFASEESQRRTEFNELYRKGQPKEALEKIKGSTDRESLTLIAKMAAGEPNAGLAEEALGLLLAVPDEDGSVAGIVAQAWQGATSFERKVAYSGKVSGLAFKYSLLAVMVQYVAAMDYPESSAEAIDRLRREIDRLAPLARRDPSLLGKIKSLDNEIEATKKNPDRYDAKHRKYEELVANIGKLAGTAFTIDRKFPKTIAAWWGVQQGEYMNQDRITAAQKKKAADEAKKAGK